MADFNLNLDNEEPVVAPVDTTDVVGTESPSIETTIPSSNVNGLLAEEVNDPNAIRVTIDDEKTPIVVLFGPPACGKTMTLVRLTRYLSQNGYEVTPVKTFRPSADTHYQKMCDNFNDMVNSDDAASSTSQISFMLVNVTKQGHPICQILEAPGEHYYMPGTNQTNFPRYINNIIAGKNRKIWVFVVEPDWMNSADRLGYVARIKRLKTKMKAQDKAVFLFNKIDKTLFVRGEGNINTHEAIVFVKNQYKGIFDSFKNENPLTKWFSEYLCEFVPFSTGEYNETLGGGMTYEQGTDWYPKKLWNLILNIKKG